MLWPAHDCSHPEAPTGRTAHTLAVDCSGGPRWSHAEALLALAGLRYADYLTRGGFTDARKALELPGVLRNGAVASEFVDHPEMPSAPLRAFSYTQASCRALRILSWAAEPL